MIEMHRHNEKGFRAEISSLMEQITYLKTIIEEKNTLVARHTKEVQHIIEGTADCKNCAHLRQ